METPNDSDEHVESLPWEHIGRPDDSGRRRLVILAAAVFVAAVTASATRTLWPSPPVSAPPVTTVAVTGTDAATPDPTTPAVVTTLTDPTAARPVTEADLRAIAPTDAARAVSAHAQWFVTEWLTADGATSSVVPEMAPDGVSLTPIEESARSFVESAIVLSVSEVAASTWEVAVLVRTLSSMGDGDYLRIPPRVFLVTVAIGDEGPFVVDLPTPGPLSIAVPPELELLPGLAPDDVLDAATAIMRRAGLVDEASISAMRGAGSGVSGPWRLSGVVRDPAGVPLEVVVWLDDAGSRIPPAGIP